MNSDDEIESEGKKEKDPLREIEIDYEMALKQVRLNILGIEIFFPYQPYENQILYMKKLIETFQNKGVAGLESPTGTGKTLCLLCASLAYLRHLRAELIQENRQKNKNEKSGEKQPIIYYTSRTHAQITNVIKELRKTVYRPINIVISSREQSCVNESVNHFSGGLINLKCEFAKKTGDCKFFKGKAKVGNGWSAYDGYTIDELKKKAHSNRFCPYYFAKDKSKHSDIIFLPYNYIFDMKISSRANLILNNSILIIDEAHNLQDICCDSASVDINTFVFEEIIDDLDSIKRSFEEYESRGIKEKNSENIKVGDLKNEIYVLNILKERIMNFKLEYKNIKNCQNPGIKLDIKSFFDLIFKSYKSSQKTITCFNNGQINQQNIQENENISNRQNIKNSNLSKNNDDVEPELTPKNIANHFSFMKEVEYYINNERGKRTLISIYMDFLEVIDLLAKNYYENDSKADPLNLFVNSFRFYIEEERENNKDSNNKKKKKISFSNSKITKRILHIFCLNPSVGFKRVIDQRLHSIIITSGTLAPIDSMESELKYNFNYKLENTHVIDDSQFRFCVLTSSPFNDCSFNFNIDNRFNIEMIYQLGLTILEFCKITPGGILVFFSSYSIMDKYVSEWTEKNIISEISKYKEFYQDRRDSRQNKIILEKYQIANSDRKRYKGGLLLSVCRGSCSEGMNFKDDMARVVIVIGIPYAMLYDPKVQLKKEFQDEYNKLLSKDEKCRGLKKLSGSEWYSQNAIKCVNQSLGRVIRHSNDYGAMILIDTRYQYIVRKNYISLWMRNKCKIYNNKNINKSFFIDMKNFFENVEEFIKNKKLKLEKSQINESSKSFSSIINSKKKSEKSSKMLNKKMNELENTITDENNDKFIIYHSKKIKINEIKIGGNDLNTKKESQKDDNQIKDFEELNLIDESFFNDLKESNDIEKIKDQIKKEDKENEISYKNLIDEFMKNKDDPKLLEALKKNGFEIKDNNEITEEKSVITCKICYFAIDNKDNKLEVGKCGHAFCQKCWKKIEDKKGNSICPICRKVVKRKERNLVYTN